jgi:ATP-dependent helicase/nuclease subunit A
MHEDVRIVKTLTDEQEQAAGRRSEPLALAAGAGSGKTSVLVERFVRGVLEDGHPADRILAITFTDRAAGELQERVRSRLLELGARDAALLLERGYVGTFHGFCARVLRAHPREAGLSEGRLEILDEGLAGRLRRQAFARALGKFLEGEPSDRVDLIAAYGPDRARATVLGVFAQLRSRGERTPRLPEPRLEGASQEVDIGGASQEADNAAESHAADVAGAAAVLLWDELLALFGERYEAAKRARGGLDFDDLELLAGELLTREETVRRAWAERFELLMVDELQDVNPRQLTIVRALERENLFTVGDEWQSIYGFRHADVNLLRTREVELSERGQSLRLAHNFRGHAELLEAVNAVFTTRFGEAFRPLRAGRESAREDEAHDEPLLELLLTHRRGWERGAVGGEAASMAHPWRQAEARQLAERVSALVSDRGVAPGEVAVLLRGTGDIDCYERALREHGLQTVASAGAFWERQEVSDLLAYLRVLEDPQDEVGLYGALAGPLAGLSTGALGLLALAAQAGGASVWETAREDPPETLSPPERERLERFCGWLSRERKLAPGLELAKLLERAVEQGCYVSHFGSMEDGERRLANVGKLIELAESWEHSEGRDLRGFLEEAAFQQGAGGGFLAGAEAIAEPDAPAEGGTRDAVQLMSVHAAKGLEFDVVCVADLGRAPSLGVPDLLVDGERVGLRLVDVEDPQSRPTLDYPQLARERRDAQVAEEDRIVYVAMTRARERLLLSGAVDFGAWPKDRPGVPPIAWLGPALAAEVPVLCREATHGRDLDPAQEGEQGRLFALGPQTDGPETDGPARPDGPARTDGPARPDGPARSGGGASSLKVDGTDVALACRLNTAGG